MIIEHMADFLQYFSSVLVSWKQLHHVFAVVCLCSVNSVIAYVATAGSTVNAGALIPIWAYSASLLVYV